MSLWLTFARHVNCCAVTVTAEGFNHTGVLSKVTLRADGSCCLLFTDGVEATIPALRSAV